MAGKREKVFIDWDAEEKRLEEEYRRKKEELRATREANEVMGQVLTRGLLPIFVLHLLDEKPHNGNDLVSEIAERTRKGWIPSTGGIYPLLRKLEKKGLVTGTWSDPEKRTQRVYTLTEKGQSELAHLREGMRGKIVDAYRVLGLVIEELFGEAPAREKGSHKAKASGMTAACGKSSLEFAENGGEGNGGSTN